MKSARHILLVDDHPLFREGFAHMVRALRPHWTLHFADSAAQALNGLLTTSPDVVVVDVGLPSEGGFFLVRAIAERSASIAVVLISGRDDAAVQLRARASGARSFISKTEDPEIIARTIDAVLDGGTIFHALNSGRDIPNLTPRQTEI